MNSRDFFKKQNMFRYFALAIVFLSFSVAVISCRSDDEELVGNWVYVNTMTGSPRGGATGTTVDVDGTEYGYVGLGMNKKGDYLTDFYSYDPTIGGSGVWDKKADFPGIGRTKAVSFSVNGELYVGSGYSGILGSDGDSIGCLKDFYKYTPSTDTWTQIDDLPLVEGEGISGATAFTLGTKGYVLCGADAEDNASKYYYIYDSETGEWTQGKDFPGNKLVGAASFVIGNKAYVGAGISNSSPQSGWYSFDGTTWVSLHSLKTNDSDDTSKDDDYGNNIVRGNTAAFVMNGKGYFATGASSSVASLSTVWEYNPTNDTWYERTGFEGSSRSYAVGLTINGQGYITTGSSSASVFDDIWRFEPNATKDSNDNE